MTPGAGFSNNIYAEIVTGLSPDQIGYFNEWEYVNEKIEPSRFYKMLHFFDLIRSKIYINAGFRRLILKRLFRLNSFNIPFKYLHLFKSGESHNFRDIAHGNILHKNNFEIFDAAEYQDNVGKRDGKALKDTIEHLSNKNHLVSLVDLDNIAHIYGMHSAQYSEHLNFLAKEIKRLCSKFRSFSENNKVVLFSDHGMTPVTQGVNFELESKLGSVSRQTYVYFVDSTYVRIWLHNKKLKPKIQEYLRSLTYGHIVSTEERKRFGFSKLEYGDLIFRANEGGMFAPNFFGARVCKAMHGYDPKLSSQSAFFSCCENSLHRIHDLPKSTLSIHSALSKIF